MSSESIGALLTRVRLARGKSQLHVAEMLCAAAGVAAVTRHEIARWEREQRLPSAYWRGWLAVVLDLPLAELEKAAESARAGRFGPGASPPLPASTTQLVARHAASGRGG